MRTPAPVKSGGFFLPNGLPDEYYAFTGGELSLTVERHSGINTISVLDILSHDGKLYPDRCPTPALLMKEGHTCGKRPVYGPGIQFISTNRQPNGRPGRNLFHVPNRSQSKYYHITIRIAHWRPVSGRFLLHPDTVAGIAAGDRF